MNSKPEVESAEKSRSGRAVRTISSDDLLRGDKELHIRHEDTIYRLTMTRQGKLILTK